MTANDYFRSHEGYFWQWEEEGEVIAIPRGSTALYGGSLTGSTIAYRAFVTEALELLCEQGIPPFGALLLVIIATNPTAETALTEVEMIMRQKVGSENMMCYMLDDALFFLRMISRLEMQYKVGKKRLLLLQVLFANCHNSCSANKATRMLNFYRSGYSKDKSVLFPAGYNPESFNKDFKTISLLIKRFPDLETIMLALADLPELNQEIPIEINETEAGGEDFIQQLIDEEKTFHSASLIKTLWGGLNIPYHNVLPSAQAIGGVSDITNKGDLHRLLISEFANDDLLFLSRLANNEALYVNREVPPHDNNLERVILIDVSIRNWGTPKTIAHALMLAIAKHPKTNIHCTAFAVGDGYTQLRFDNMNEVIAGLQVLEPCLHPGAGLTSFFREYGHDNLEVFFISSTESYRQPALHKAISDHYALFKYWVHTDDQGNIDIYKRQQQTKKHVTHMCLPLKTLWKRETKPGIPAKQDDAPVHYPLLFPASHNPRKILVSNNGDVFYITVEGHLFKVYNNSYPYQRGWIMIYEDLPFKNGEAEIGLLENGEYVLLLFNIPIRELILINLNTGKESSMTFQEWRTSTYKRFLFYNNRFYFAYKGYPSKHWTFHLDEEVILQSFNGIPEQVERKLWEDQKGKDPNPPAYPSQAIFKNIQLVYINEVNNLVFNKQELRLIDGHLIKIKQTSFAKVVFAADSHGKNAFLFAEGSSITLNKSGMMTFKSSNPQLPQLFIPLVLDVSLGAATEHEFAGNPYYHFPQATGSEIMNTGKFWNNYIQPFIDHIIHAISG